VILYETSNNIEMHIQNKPLCTAWNGGYAIEGIQDATGTQAAYVPGRNYPTQWMASNDAWRFSPNCCTMNVSELNSVATFSIYPNPSNGDIHFIASESIVKEFYISVSDLSGRVVYQDELSTGKDRHLNVNASGGVYLLQLHGRNGEVLASRKIVIE
jgi:hypothetical protein